ncbi:MAG: hypothetical protein U5L11_05280 [Arhodomonas sp.]|nr:hypothetical protein [Arhodomonas sp.]
MVEPGARQRRHAPRPAAGPLDRETRLLAVEINGGLFRLLQGIHDPRSILTYGSAADLAQASPRPTATPASSGP